MRNRRPPATIRTRLLGVVVLSSAIILTALVTAFNVALRATLDDDATSVAQARASALLATLDTTGGHVSSGEAPDDAAIDARAWVYDGTTLVEGPQASTAALDAAAAAAASAAPNVATALGQRLASVPVARGSETIGAVVAAAALGPYRATGRTVLIWSVGLAVVLLGAIALIGAWTLRRALQPVHEMTRLAAEWSERDPDRRFAQGPPRDELTELAATLDSLLGRVAASLRREQRFSAELAHELRTPLSRIAAECELALRERGDDQAGATVVRAIAGSAEEMRRTIDVLVAAARHGAGHERGVADIATVIDALVARAAVVARERGVEVIAPSVSTRRIALDADLAERIIAPIVENAVRYAARRVTLSVTDDGALVAVHVDDDGAGIDPAERDRIFEPGMRGADPRGDGAGLGLALARRIAGDVGARIDLDQSTDGTRFSIRLPRP